MSKPKQWKQGRELKHADAWSDGVECGGDIALIHGTFDLQSCVVDGRLQLNDAYPQEAEQPDRLWVGSGDAS